MGKVSEKLFQNTLKDRIEFTEFISGLSEVYRTNLTVNHICKGRGWIEDRFEATICDHHSR